MNGERGFSLVEALVALAVFGLVMVGAFTLFASNHGAYRRGHNMAEAQQNARVALEGVLREVRLAGYDLSGVLPGLGSPTPIQKAQAAKLTFVADVTRDGVLDQVTYRLAAGDLIREISSWDGSGFPAPSESVVANDLDSLGFTYFDGTTPTNVELSSPVPTADLGDIRRIRIGLVARHEALGTGDEIPLSADVTLRN